MPNQYGDTGKSAVSPLKTFTFTNPNARESDLGGSALLPTTEPATSQVIWTVGSGDLPSISPPAYSMKYCVWGCVSGKCTTAATLSYRIIKNGSSLATATTGGVANQFWTHNHYRWFDVVVGDVLEVRMWSTQADTTIDYSSVQVLLASIYTAPPNIILKDFTVSGTSATATPTGLGIRSTTVGNTQGLSLTPANFTNVGNVNFSGSMTIYAFMPNPSFPTLRVNAGDISAASTTPFNNATSINYARSFVPATITYREVLR